MFRLKKFPKTEVIELDLLPLLQLNKKKEGKSCIGGEKYAAKEYLPPPSKMSGITLHEVMFIYTSSLLHKSAGFLPEQ